MFMQIQIPVNRTKKYRTYSRRNLFRPLSITTGIPFSIFCISLHILYILYLSHKHINIHSLHITNPLTSEYKKIHTPPCAICLPMSDYEKQFYHLSQYILQNLDLIIKYFHQVKPLRTPHMVPPYHITIRWFSFAKTDIKNIRVSNASEGATATGHE